MKLEKYKTGGKQAKTWTVYAYDGYTKCSSGELNKRKNLESREVN